MTLAGPPRALEPPPEVALRHRLEGRLELVQGAVASLEAAAEELERNDWYRALAWPAAPVGDAALGEAVEALARRLRETPVASGGALLERLQAARGRLHRAAAARLAGLTGRPPTVEEGGTLEAALAGLRAHLPIALVALPAARPWRWVAWSLILAGGAAVSLRLGLPWLAVPLGAGVVGAWVFGYLAERRSEQAGLLTRRAVAVGQLHFPLGEVEALHLEHRPEAVTFLDFSLVDAPRWALVFTLKGGAQARMRFRHRPGELIDRLHERGVHCAPSGPGGGRP